MKTIAKLEIPYKFPSANDYINACRSNKYSAASMKKKIQNDISVYIRKLPKFENPVFVNFHWIEGNNRRDWDNVGFAKKFILDALVQNGKLKDDNRKCVVGYTDKFSVKEGFSVELEIIEVEQ